MFRFTESFSRDDGGGRLSRGFLTSTEHQLAGRLVGNMVWSSSTRRNSSAGIEAEIWAGRREELRWDRTLISSGQSGAARRKFFSIGEAWLLQRSARVRLHVGCRRCTTQLLLPARACDKQYSRASTSWPICTRAGLAAISCPPVEQLQGRCCTWMGRHGQMQLAHHGCCKAYFYLRCHVLVFGVGNCCCDVVARGATHV